MPGKKLLTQERLRELFDYSPETGLFIRKISISSRAQAGSVAGTRHHAGYIQISINYKKYLAHRLAFLYIEGYFPEHRVDHYDGIKDNNRWKNLRHASAACNQQNRQLRIDSTSGFTGISWQDHAKKWYARIYIHGKCIYLGHYTTAEEAALARCHFENECPDWTCNHLAVNRVKLRSMGYEI